MCCELTYMLQTKLNFQFYKTITYYFYNGFILRLKGKNMKPFLPLCAFSALLVTSCFENATPPNSNVISAASCPTAAVSVFKVSYNENQGKYTIFHSAGNESKSLPNPLNVKNIQMAQMAKPQGSSSETAKLNFAKADGGCTPVLELTEGYKIDLVAANAQTNANGETVANTGSSGSSWAPFLMGALVGNAVSNAMQPRYAPPAYYLPPPAASQGGLVTGGVSGKTPDELNKKYENQYKQSPTKKGFFSSQSKNYGDESKPKKSGFFSGKSDSSSSKKSSGFFRKKK